MTMTWLIAPVQMIGAGDAFNVAVPGSRLLVAAPDSGNRDAAGVAG